MFETNDVVSIRRCSEYNSDIIYGCLKAQAEVIGLSENEIRGKKVAIKPNLLLGYTPDKAATTNPAVIEAVIRLIRDYKPKELIIAESPGGVYSNGTLTSIYRSTGMQEVSERTGVPLNFDTGSVEVSNPDGRVSKVFNIINPLNEADVIFNVCKLKTHNLSKMTASVKNLFGSIPGITKFEMHARFKEQPKFFGMLVDLCTMLHKQHNIINICDAVIAMEGNGPSGGEPRHADCLLMSRNPFALDAVCSKIIGLRDVEMIEIARSYGLCPKDDSMLNTEGEDLSKLIIPDFVPPDTSKGKKFDYIPKFLQPRPVIDKKKCAGCGMCVHSCPMKTIKLIKRKAEINPKNCIKCYCCQELCTFKAVKIKKSFIYRLIK